MSTVTFPVTGDDAADALLVTDPLALLIGMLLDQQVPMEWAFKGPHTLEQRLGGLDEASIAAMPLEDLEAVFKEKPALHRYPGSMAKRTSAMCAFIVEHHGGRAEAIWEDAQSAEDLLARLKELPGFGEEKSRIFVAVLGKRFDAAPQGWEQVAGPFGDDTPRSVADIDSPEALAEVRAWKRAQKAKGKSKAD